MNVRGILRCVASCAAVLSIGPQAQGQVDDIEPNSSLVEVQAVQVTQNSTTINGLLDVVPVDWFVYDDVVYDALDAGTTNFHDFYGLPAGASVAAYVDNTVGFGRPDTLLRSFDEFGDENAYNDDGSVLGDGFASRVFTNVLEDGSLHVELSGYPDVLFENDHQESGDYAIFVKLGPFGDTDFYEFTGLLPGSQWEAQTGIPEDSPVDTMLSWYGSEGEELDQNDDVNYPDDLSSHLSGVVPDGGTVILAVTAYPDFKNIGSHQDAGFYGLSFLASDVMNPTVLGDTDADRDVDLDDLNNVRNYFGGQGLGDADSDGDVDLDDLNAVRNNFGTSGAQAVPEPSTIALGLAVIAVLSAAKVRRARRV